jgi:hypothetical protein
MDMLHDNKRQNNLLETRPTIISLIPFLIDAGEGHDFSYNRSVQKAAESIGWKYIAAVPETAKGDLPPGWCKCLPHRYLLKKNVFFKINTSCLYIISFSRFLRKNVIPESPVQVIFIESFYVLHLAALTCALLLTPRENISVWLLYRYPPSMFGKLKWRVFKFLNGVIKQIIKPGRFHLLTDSDVLAKSLSAFFKQPVKVVPVPHIDIFSRESFSKSSPEIMCWWPGSPATSKGWDIIRRIAKLRAEEACKFCLVAAESSNIQPTPGGVKVQLVKNFLPRSVYLEWMYKSDMILLPYNSESHSERTSGIFVECIAAGKIPIVTEGTWMAKELRKFDLDELIVNWLRPDILCQLLKIANDKAVKDKVAEMRKAYLAFHNENNFAVMMRALFEE